MFCDNSIKDFSWNTKSCSSSIFPFLGKCDLNVVVLQLKIWFSFYDHSNLLELFTFCECKGLLETWVQAQLWRKLCPVVFLLAYVSSIFDLVFILLQCLVIAQMNSGWLRFVLLQVETRLSELQNTLDAGNHHRHNIFNNIGFNLERWTITVSYRVEFAYSAAVVIIRYWNTLGYLVSVLKTQFKKHISTVDYFYVSYSLILSRLNVILFFYS